MFAISEWAAWLFEGGKAQKSDQAAYDFLHGFENRRTAWRTGGRSQKGFKDDERNTASGGSREHSAKASSLEGRP
jgi:hypothetical protein